MVSQIKPYKRCKKCGALIVSGSLCEDCKPMTNGDKIRAMTDEELVMDLDTDCNRCAKSEKCELRGDPVSYGICVEGNIEWLKQEVSEDAGSKTD